MRFPLRRNNIDDRLAVLRLPPEDVELEPLPNALPFVRFAATGPARNPEPEPVLAPPPPPALPALPFTMPLKGQSTGADSRADRLVRQIRDEVDGMRQTLDELSTERGSMLEVDPASVMANPEAAASLPPAALVRALIASAERAHTLEARLAHEQKKASKLRASLRKVRTARAETRGRLDTLEEVIAALHANLEDLRGDRQNGRAIAATPPAPELRSAPAELPAAFPPWMDHD